jgi:phospholipid transport system substrate-binding protein
MTPARGRTMVPRPLAGFVAWLCLVGAVGAQTDPAAAARAVVERLQEALIQAMKTDTYQARYALLAPVVVQTHDLDAIARVALGRKLWAELSQAQRARYLDLFRRMSVAAYARAFASYSGERFEVLSTQPVRKKGMLVRTRLYKADGGSVQLDYHLRQREGRWRIVNVVSDGVSDLALKRDQFRNIAETRGMEGLFTELEAQSEPPDPRPNR